MGGIINYLPLTHVNIVIASLSLSGIPFFTGSYSKDTIIEIAASHYSVLALFVFWVSILTAFLTAVYSVRLIILSMLANSSTYQFLLFRELTEVNARSHTQNHQLIINGLLCFLSIASLSFGFICKDVFDYRFWGQAIWVDPAQAIKMENEFLNSRMKLLPVILSFLGILLSSCLQLCILQISTSLNLTSLLSNKWNTDLAINHSIVVPILNLCEWITYRVIDKGLIEIVGPSGVSIYQETTAFLQLIFNGHLFNSINIITLFATITITLINYGYKDHLRNPSE
jgi:NADH:ubiquinone oxidoreductase subunit 5 (subunit L)/multisubunit Na+/H+ antiporter MnhA subunit